MPSSALPLRLRLNSFNFGEALYKRPIKYRINTMIRTVPSTPCDRYPYPYPPVGNAPSNKRMTTIRMISPM